MKSDGKEVRARTIRVYSNMLEDLICILHSTYQMKKACEDADDKDYDGLEAHPSITATIRGTMVKSG